MEMSDSTAAQPSGSSTAHSDVVAELESRLNGRNRERRPSDSLIPDPNVLVELEAHARAISSNLDMALRDLRGAVHGISDLSLETMQVFGSVVNETCDSVDVIIRAMYTVLSKTEELHSAFEGIQRLALQIKDMKRLVDTLEKLFVETTTA
ncbi:BLOC (Biogenesis of Lysosome-related Organelles Complex) and Related complexes subunit-like protein [Aphelenchoides fujianensis]|nr:BLOC (Biogenesis of Lysosome-related Organelles Complex) and Related complexes subunit-like protein [Aphelenchoides fujianensis]